MWLLIGLASSVWGLMSLAMLGGIRLFKWRPGAGLSAALGIASPFILVGPRLLPFVKEPPSEQWLSLSVWLALGTMAVCATVGLWRLCRLFPRTVGTILGTMTVAATIGWVLVDRTAALRGLPPAVKEAAVLYRKEESWGIPLFPLPGDNETGLIVYALSERDVLALQAEIHRELRPQDPTGPQPDAPHEFVHWRATPIPRAGWPRPEGAHDAVVIDDFLNQYGFAIPMDRELESTINLMLQSPGNYVTGGADAAQIMIFSPSRRLLVFAYAG